MSTVAGLVPDEVHVLNAMRELKAAGFTENNVSVLHTAADVWNRLGGDKNAQVVIKDAAIGALFGLALGSLLGVTTGILNCALMDCPIERSVIFLALIVLYCSIGGGLFGAILGLDQRENSLYFYIDGVRRGQALFVVETSDERASEAKRILQKERSIIIEDVHEEVE